MNAEVQFMRDALGAIAVAAPAAYRLRQRGPRDWAVQREGEAVETHYSNRVAAMRAIHLAVVRCTAYRVSMPASDGWQVIEASDETALGRTEQSRCEESPVR